jgi:hypothetical protein
MNMLTDVLSAAYMNVCFLRRGLIAPYVIGRFANGWPDKRGQVCVHLNFGVSCCK